MKKIIYALVILTSIFSISNVKAAEEVCDSLNCAYSCEGKTYLLMYKYNGIGSVLPTVHDATLQGSALNYQSALSSVGASGLSVTNNGSDTNACTCPTSVKLEGNTLVKGSGCSSVQFDSVNYVDSNETGGKTYEKVQCGDVTIPYLAPKILSTVINILMIATPILIILFGSLDLVKAVIAQKDDEIKKGQQTFIRRLIVGACVFLVFVAVQFIFNIIAPKTEENTNMWSCVDCFVNGNCDSIKVN